jgi:hypothetical protein
LGGYALECALLMRQQDLGWQRMRIVKKRIGGFGILPIGSGSIDRSLRMGTKRFGECEQAPIQARIAQVGD